MTLMVAEVVALRYFRALREGSTDPVLTDVAGRILADEQRHVPFHAQRLRDGFAALPRPARTAAAAGWWVLMLGAAGVVAVDHAPALRHLGVAPYGSSPIPPLLFRPVAAEVLQAPRDLTDTNTPGVASQQQSWTGQVTNAT
jgi:hypothetical protein